MPFDHRLFSSALIIKLGDFSWVHNDDRYVKLIILMMFISQESTIGAAFFSQTVSVNSATVKFEIWDTAGQERYHSLAPMYYRGAAAAIIVYDITSSVFATILICMSKLIYDLIKFNGCLNIYIAKFYCHQEIFDGKMDC